MLSSRSSISIQVFAGAGSVKSLILRSTLYWLAPLHGPEAFSQLFIDMLRARRYSTPPCLDMLLSAGQCQTSKEVRLGCRWLRIRYNTFVLSGVPLNSSHPAHHVLG